MSDSKAMESDELTALGEILQNTPYKAVNKISYGSYGEIFKIRDADK
jgi:hypothetical protein